MFLNITAVNLAVLFNCSPKHSSSHEHYYKVSEVQGEGKYQQPNERENVNNQSSLPATQQQQQKINTVNRRPEHIAEAWKSNMTITYA